jgi:probable F420-dependent oxidoreductase
MHPTRVGLKIAQDAPISAFRQVWTIADQGGFDHCWAFDHLATVADDGRDRLVFEGWSLLAAMAVATTRVRLGLSVTGMVHRHPALLAKTAVTVDHLSDGRLEFGIGAGWAEVENRMFGINVQHSVDRLAEGLDVIQMLWTQDRSDYQGRYFRLEQAAANPRPMQKPHPPIWVGAGGPRTLRIAASRADVWLPSMGDLEAAEAAGRQLAADCRAIGRDPAEIRWSAQVQFDGSDPQAAIAELRRWLGAGFTELVVYCAGPDPVRAAEVAVEKLLPELR